VARVEALKANMKNVLIAVEKAESGVVYAKEPRNV